MTALTASGEVCQSVLCCLDKALKSGSGGSVWALFFETSHLFTAFLLAGRRRKSTQQALAANNVPPVCSQEHKEQRRLNDNVGTRYKPGAPAAAARVICSIKQNFRGLLVFCGDTCSSVSKWRPGTKALGGRSRFSEPRTRTRLSGFTNRTVALSLTGLLVFSSMSQTRERGQAVSKIVWTDPGSLSREPIGQKAVISYLDELPWWFTLTSPRQTNLLTDLRTDRPYISFSHSLSRDNLSCLTTCSALGTTDQDNQKYPKYISNDIISVCLPLTL